MIKPRTLQLGILGILGITAILLAACDATPRHVEVQGRRHRLAEAGVQSFDSAGQFYRVGMSAVAEVDVKPLRKRDLQGDTLGEAYHLFLTRCGACHDVPAPGSKEAWQWSGTVSRMRVRIEKAGLLPMSDDAQGLVAGLLERHGG